MSSIVYVTDDKLIEYHRLQGNDEINFWRPKANKSFSNFDVGDILFFLVKKSERANSKEKGIVGYGHLKEINELSLNSCWKIFGSKNGANTKEEFHRMVMKLSKDEIPKKLQCLILERVVFFQAPVYLSEFEIFISNNVESYLYLDKLANNGTIDVLKKAKDVGIDAWSLALNYERYHYDVFAFDLIAECLANIHKNINFQSSYSKKFAQSAFNYISLTYKCHYIKNSFNHFFSLDNSTIELYLACSLSKNKVLYVVKDIIAQVRIYRCLFSAQLQEIRSLNFTFISNYQLDNFWIEILKNEGINFIVIDPLYFA